MKALITVTGVQNLQESGDDSIELVTDGVYTKIPDGYAVKYRESELTGLEGTTTTVEILPDKVSVSRKGTLNMTMDFEEGKKSDFLYDTMFGSATLSFMTHKIVADFNDRGGKLSIDYVVNMEHAVVGKNRINMRVIPR